MPSMTSDTFRKAVPVSVGSRRRWTWPVVLVAAAALAIAAAPATAVTQESPAAPAGEGEAGEAHATPAGGDSRPGQPPRPRLIVQIVVDQLSADLFRRYDSIYSGGLRRLLDRGRHYTDFVFDHALTNTAPGHATLATGTHPRRHGVPSNYWHEPTPDGPARVNNSVDTTESLVGVRGHGRSPRKLLRSGFADWLRTAQPEARVVSLSRKPRGAILPAGREADHVYWYSAGAGRFVTSTYYREEDPDWVRRFHRETWPELAADTVWRLEVPAGLRSLARRDSAPFEAGGEHFTFPHRFHAEDGAGLRGRELRAEWYDWLRGTPVLDRAVLLMAREAVTSLELGSDGATDFLSLSLSQTDAVGHTFGPYSLEQLDNLLRLDRRLGGFLDFLDRRVGPDAYVVALTSDHGILPMPEHLQEAGIPAERLTRERGMRLLAAAGRAGPDRTGDEETAAPEDPAGGPAGGGRHGWEANVPGPGTVDPEIQEAVRDIPWVRDAFTPAELARATPADSFAYLYRNSYRPDRWAGFLDAVGLAVRLPEWWPHSTASGASHGSPYYYDRHVPLLLAGPGIPPGTVSERARAVDLAPTLAVLADIAHPPDLDGISLLR